MFTFPVLIIQKIVFLYIKLNFAQLLNILEIFHVEFLILGSFVPDVKIYTVKMSAVSTKMFSLFV